MKPRVWEEEAERGGFRCCDCGALCGRKAKRCRVCYYLVSSPTPVEERVWQFVVWNGDPDECWTWEGSRIGATGYGHINRGPGLGNVLAHRLMYEMFVGSIPDGLELDHTCHNPDLSCKGGSTCLHRACVNPAHLEAVTQSVNAQRGRTGESPGSRGARWRNRAQG